MKKLLIAAMAISADKGTLGIINGVTEEFEFLADEVANGSFVNIVNNADC